MHHLPEDPGYVKTFYVWRHKAGHVDAACSDAGREQDWDSDGFTLLLSTTDWPAARARIEEERGKGGT